jgi:hypothetical protein
MIFAFDKLTDWYNRPYPNLATWKATPYTEEWRQFSDKWPFSEPFHFIDYLDNEFIEFQTFQSLEAPTGSLYPISISFFDFSVDWFEIMPKETLGRMQRGELTPWFYYSEGDNPQRIKDHLDQLIDKHYVKYYHFTSANTAANQIPCFSYFADDELLYKLRNEVPPVVYHEQFRDKKFTALVRTHKWWRASTMAEIWSKNLHHDGYFSYTTDVTVGESKDDNPIELDRWNLREQLDKFLKACPFTADTHDSDFHNLYHYTVEEHFSNSYLNLVLETHLDADQSNGAFITEKTFKPIKNGQMFIIIGAPGSLDILRQMGYKTFGHVINNEYDSISDNNRRWRTALDEFYRIVNSNTHEIYRECRDDIIHNQNLFLSSKLDRLNTLIQKVKHEQS